MMKFFMKILFNVVLVAVLLSFGISCSDKSVEPVKDFSQVSFEKTFGGEFNDIGNSVLVTSDGNYLIAGETSLDGIANNNAYLIKTSNNGDLLWEKNFGSLGYDRILSACEVSDGGYLLCGETRVLGFWDAYIIKTDNNGTLLWEKTIGGTSSDHGYDILEISDGGFVFVGSTTSFGNGRSDVYIVKIDNNGNKIWENSFGGEFWDVGNDIIETNDGGFIITGWTSSQGAGSDDVYIIKTNSTGELVWEKTFGGTGEDYGYSGVETSEGGYVFTGRTNSSGAGSNDVYVIKTDSNGTRLWDKTFGDIGDDKGSSICESSDGGYVIVGSIVSTVTSTDLYLIKTDNNGNSLWTKTFGGTSTDYGYSVNSTSDGGFIITGSTKSFESMETDVYLIKTDSDGNVD